MCKAGAGGGGKGLEGGGFARWALRFSCNAASLEPRFLLVVWKRCSAASIAVCQLRRAQHRFATLAQRKLERLERDTQRRCVHEAAILPTRIEVGMFSMYADLTD